MPTNSILLAIAAGLISAVVFASATTGPMLLRVVLFFLTPLSLYLAGLGLGQLAVMIAAGTATLIILLIASPLTAGIYAISTAIPAVVCSRLAVLSRENGDEREWYPVGRIVVTAAVFGGIFAALALILMGGDVEALTKTMRSAVETFFKSELPKIPGAPDVTDAQITEITATTLKTLPSALGVLAMVTILLNLWLAGRITLASGRLLRPWPDLAALELPTGATFTLFGVTALTFLGGLAGLLAGGFAGPFTLAFALVGLACAHVLSRGSPWRSFLLSAIYAAIVVFTAGASIVLAIVGLAETIFGYRTVRDRGPPENSI